MMDMFVFVQKKAGHVKRIEEKRKIKQFSKNNEFIKEWDSARDIQTSLNIAESNINKCCNGHIKTAYGYVWKYSDAIVK